ncbi:hypothetical protein BDZ97DRAFT_1925850 [Flammula alnicola]|nr:hypothetical protein BDZ97DRAFT_1925850 [Flammula alnicola]
MSPAGTFHPSPYSSPGERHSLVKSEDVEDDKRSTMSQASGVPRADQGLDALQLVAGNRVRHARCAPEFLEEIATKGVQDSLRKATSKKFKVIAGSEARTYFKNYIGQYNKRESKALRNDNDKITTKDMPVPIVFAVTVWEAGNKCVDYHMTWRGNAKARESKDFERKVSHFDSEFRRLARVLDKEYKRISSLRTYRNLSQTHRKPEKKTRSSPPSHKSRPPPGIMVSTPEEPSAKPENQINPSLPEPPVSAADSVMSLPMLNMVRGVPFSHRVPLRVTNPDRISEINIIPGQVPETLPASQPITETGHTASNNTLSIPVISKSSKHDDVKKSSASIRSSDTRSSKSSRSSRSSSRSENLSSRNPSPGDRDKADESTRRGDKHSSREEDSPEFLIVLLGDTLDIDVHSWHGLERQTSIRSVPADRHSPWIGPLACPENPTDRQYTPTRTPNDSDSEASEADPDHWKNIPVIPMKPLMEAMGLIPNISYYSPPVVPGGLQYHTSISNAGSPAPNQSPYLYSSPRLDSSPFVPPWLPQLQILPNATSRPPSRAYSSASYASPYMQSNTGPF